MSILIFEPESDLCSACGKRRQGMVQLVFRRPPNKTDIAIHLCVMCKQQLREELG